MFDFRLLLSNNSLLRTCYNIFTEFYHETPKANRKRCLYCCHDYM